MYEVVYDTVKAMDLEELLLFYERQGFRSTTSRRKLQKMIECSFCFVTARVGGSLIGIARGVSDGLNGQLVECKLDASYQGPAAVTRKEGRIEHDTSGIAEQMARRVIEALSNDEVERIWALAYGTEVDFCEDLGFRKIGGTQAMTLELGREAAVPASVG